MADDLIMQGYAPTPTLDNLGYGRRPFVTALRRVG